MLLRLPPFFSFVGWRVQWTKKPTLEEEKTRSIGSGSDQDNYVFDRGKVAPKNFIKK